MDKKEKQALLLTLEQNKVHVQNIWDDFVEFKGGRATDEQVKLYQFIKTSLKNSIRKIQREIGATDNQ